MIQLLRSSILLLVLAVGPAAAGQASDAPPPADSGHPAARILVRTMGDPKADLARVREELAALGPAAAPALLEIAARSRATIPGPGGKEFEIALREDLGALVIQVLAAMPREELLPALTALGGDERTSESCIAGMRVLEGVGDQRDLALLHRLAELDGKELAATPAQRTVFESALRAILIRVPAARVAMRKGYATASPALAFSIIRATRGGAPAIELESLVALLGWRPAEDPLLLNEIARAARTAELPAPDFLRAPVRRALAGTQPELVRAAALACGELEDDEAVPGLIALLDHADAGTVRVARTALQRIAHKDLGAKPSSWESWYRAESEWWDKRAELCAEEIARGPASSAAAAVTEAARCRLFRGEIARMLAGGLDRSEVQIVHLCCQALGQLRSPIAIPYLEPALVHEDPKVRDSARRAVQRIEEAGRVSEQPAPGRKTRSRHHRG